MQWSSDESFGSGSGEAKVLASAVDSTEWMTYTIEGQKQLVNASYVSVSSIDLHTGCAYAPCRMQQCFRRDSTREPPIRGKENKHIGYGLEK